MNHSLRVWTLPTHLQHLVHLRLASTCSNPFPYPTHARPTPHQIFHLPSNASQQDIKARYYDLVRIHHPDSQLCRGIPHEERQSRFKAITAAYDILRGARSHHDDVFAEELHRRKRAWGSSSHRHRHHYSPGGNEYTYVHGYEGSADDRWKDRIIVLVGIFTLAAGLLPGIFYFPVSMEHRHRTASANLAEARKDAREDGLRRRTEIRKRVAENRLLAAGEENRENSLSNDENA